MKLVSHICLGFFFLCLSFASLGAPAALHTSAAGNMYAGGADLTIATPISGDLLAAGARVSLESPVGQDAALAGGNVDVRAPVGQDLRVAGGTLSLGADVGGELTAAGGTVTLKKNARVGGDAMLAGSEIAIDGKIARNASVRGRSIAISGEIGGDAKLHGEQIRLLPGARIGGNLTYNSPTPLPAESAAMVQGTITYQQAASQSSTWRIEGGKTRVFFWFPAVFALGMLAAGILLLLLFPNAVAGSHSTLAQYPPAVRIVGKLPISAFL